MTSVSFCSTRPERVQDHSDDRAPLPVRNEKQQDQRGQQRNVGAAAADEQERDEGALNRLLREARELLERPLPR